MATTRRRGGLFVATAAICFVLLSATTCVEAESLRGSLVASGNTSPYTQFIDNNRRRVEGGGGGGGEGGGEGGQQGNEGGKNEGNNKNEGQNNKNEGQEGQQQQEGEQKNEGEQNNKNEQEGEQQQQQQEEKQQDQGEEDGQQNEANEEAEEEVAYQYDDIVYSDDQSSDDFNMHDTVVNLQDDISNMLYRFNEDIVAMWSMSPSEWDDEHWTVLGITAGVLTLLLSCICCICCTCFGGNDEEIADASKKTPMQKKNHRGRLFNRMRETDADTVASGATEGADNTQFHLLDDAVAMSRMPLSPKSAAPEDDDQTKATKASVKSPRKKKGVLNEAVDVWSEFLGFKKVKSYNTLAFIKHRARDDDRYLDTDDDLTRTSRMSRSRSSRTRMGRTRRRSSSRASSRRGRHMEAGSYVAPTESSSDRNRLGAQTPVITNTEPSSPRSTRSRSNSRTRGVLLKTRSILKSFSKDSTKEIKKNESGNVDMVLSASSSQSA